jgi:hypothetical protein
MALTINNLNVSEFTLDSIGSWPLPIRVGFSTFRFRTDLICVLV